MKHETDMCTYGIIMSALIHTMIGKNHLKLDMPGEFFEQSFTKILDHYRYNPVNALYNTTYPSKIKPYAEDIKRLLSKGKTFRQISSYIREKGYKGADSTIRMYATRIMYGCSSFELLKSKLLRLELKRKII